MGSRYLTALADWCRAAGLNVVETGGWQTRARSSGGFDGNRPWVVAWHHTASQTSPSNDVDYMVNGSPDRPVANLYLARDGSVHVMAAGATNTNGKGYSFKTSKGVIPNDQLNTHAVSIEAANNGVGEAWTQQQIDAYFRLSLALTEALGLAPGDVCNHQTWAPDRKIDPATAAAVQGPWRPRPVGSSGTWNQSDVVTELIERSGVPDPPPLPEDEMTFIYAFQHYADTFSETGVALTPEAFNAMKAAGAVVIVSADHDTHLESLLHLSGLDRQSLTPK